LSAPLANLSRRILKVLRSPFGHALMRVAINKLLGGTSPFASPFQLLLKIRRRLSFWNHFPPPVPNRGIRISPIPVPRNSLFGRHGRVKKFPFFSPVAIHELDTPAPRLRQETRQGFNHAGSKTSRSLDQFLPPVPFFFPIRSAEGRSVLFFSQFLFHRETEGNFSSSASLYAVSS